MSQELIYTSAPTGLKPGSKGFCTVAMTSGLPTGWVDRLEPLSGYKGIYPLGDPKSDRNPVNFSHWRVAVSGKTKSVLSRVAFAGADYSGRSNKLAHHLVLEPAEQAAGGPAWMLLKPGTVRTTWTGAPQQFAAGPKLPTGDRAPSICTMWASLCGDAGWAGVLAESFATDPAKPAYVVYLPGTDILRAFDESLALLPAAKRWEVTFSTFFTELPLNLTCAWRGVVAGTPAATEAVRLGPRALVIDLTKSAAAPLASAYADAARAGNGVVIAAGARVAGPAKKLAAVAGSSVDPEDSGIVEVPFRKDTAVPAIAARVGRRLVPDDGSADLETEIQMGELVEANGDSQLPKHIIVNRGVRRSVFAVSVVGCLVVGPALTYFFMRHQFEIAGATTLFAQDKIKEADRAIGAAHSERDDFEQRMHLAERRLDGAGEASAQMQGSVKTLTARNEALTQENKQLKAQLASVPHDVASVPDTAPVVAKGNQATTQQDWVAVIDRPLDFTPLELTQVEGNSTSKSGKVSVPPGGLPAGGSLLLLWQNNSVTLTVPKKYELRLKSKASSEDASVQVAIQLYDSSGELEGDPKDAVAISVHGTDGKIEWLISPDGGDQRAYHIVADSLSNCVFALLDKDGRPTSRFFYKRKSPPVDLTGDSYEIPTAIFDGTVCLDGSIPDWEKKSNADRSVLTFSKKGHPDIEFDFTATTTDKKHFLTFGWPDKYGKYATLLKELKLRRDDLTSGDLHRIERIAGGGKRFDVGDWPSGNLSALFETFKSETRKSNDAADMLKADTRDSDRKRDQHDKDNADDNLSKARAELGRVIDEKEEWVKTIAVQDFSVQITLPNMIPLVTVNVKAPTQ